jgi:hypothetical protein
LPDSRTRARTLRKRQRPLESSGVGHRHGA